MTSIAQMPGRAPSRRGSAGREPMPIGAGSICLDFVATLDGAGEQARDLIATPGGLAQWLGLSGLPVPVGGISALDVAAAGGLRSAIDGVARAVISGRTPDSSAIQVINAAVQHPTPVYLMQADGRRRVPIGLADVRASLAVIARDAVHMLTGSDVDRVRECSREGCGSLFLDRSPSGRRRWCSMKGCGEMVASASYRRRRAQVTAIPAARPSIEQGR